MSNLNEASEFTALYRMYKQLQSENQHPEAVQPQPPGGLQNPQRAQPRQSPARIRPQPYRQPPLRNAPELSTLAQMLDELKKRQDDIFTALNALQNMSEHIKVTVEENMAQMHGHIQRFQMIGKSFLEALQSSNSQQQSGSSSQPHASSNPPALNQNTFQQQTSSNLSKPYGQGPNITQPPTFNPSSNPSQFLYAPPPAQAPESYPDPTYEDYGLEFLANDTS